MRRATATAPGPRLSALSGRVLAATGNASERSWLAASLTAFGLQSAFVADSDALLQAFLGGEFDLVIVDAVLPGATDACGLIHQQDPAIPVVTLGDAGGAADFPPATMLRKPLDRRRLHRLLSGRLRPVHAATPPPGDDSELAAQLAELRRGYIGRLDAAVLQPMHAAAATGDWLAVRQMAHRLSGTAGCHGLASLAAAAAALEIALLAPSTPALHAQETLLAAVNAAAADTIAEVNR